MEEMVKQALAAVSAINDDMDQESDSQFHLVELRTTGYAILVQWLGRTVWSSEDDERAFDEERNEYEPLEPFLRRACAELARNVSAESAGLRTTGPA